MDEEYHWVFCGDESCMTLYGPFARQEHAEGDVDTARCDHDHLISRQTLAQVAASVPKTARLQPDGVINKDGDQIIGSWRPYVDRAAYAELLSLLVARGCVDF